MELAEKRLFKRIGVIDKIKKILGYREGKKFIIDTKPKIKNYSEIELMNIATIEEKLKQVLEVNESNGSTSIGIREQEAISLLEWTVQNARIGLAKSENEDIADESLLGTCGLGQGITGTTLKNMGLSPYIINACPTLAKNGFNHAYVVVDIPIQQNESIQNKSYLIDTTVRQFFLRDEITNSYRTYIKDKKFGNRVAPLPGYWMLKMENGEKIASKLLSDGFIELTEENAKIYGDSFKLAEKIRKRPTKVPRKSELYTGIQGKQYIANIKRNQMQEEIDYDDDELEINIKTPFMMKIEMVNNKKVMLPTSDIPKENQKELELS